MSVVVSRGVPSVPELADAGVSRVSVGASFAFAGYAALIDAARELQAGESYGFVERARFAYGEGLRDAVTSPGP